MMRMRRLVELLNAIDPWDLSAAIGLALVIGGVWMVYPAAAVILLGLMLAGLGLWGARVFAGPFQRRDDK
jgi:hypothetical protein